MLSPRLNQLALCPEGNELPEEERQEAVEETGEEELSEEEKGRRIAAQWTHDPAAVGGGTPPAPEVESATELCFRP